MTSNEEEWAARNAEATREWHADRRACLVENFLRRRPSRFAAPGELDPRIAGWADDLLDGKEHNLILAGPVGCGKTWQLWHAGERIIRAGYEDSFLIVRAADFRRTIAPATADPGQFSRYCRAGVLALDDIGSVRLSDWDLDQLGDLIDSRWSDSLPTVVASNKMDLRELVGERIASRIADGVLTVKMAGADRRRQT